MSKKKSDTGKKPKEKKASKTGRKVPGKIEELKKEMPAPAPQELAAEPAKPVAAEKPKLTLPKKPAPVKRPAAGPSLDDIALRAYFIAERRKKMGWRGDETSDWVEAERQLLAEAAKKGR